MENRLRWRERAEMLIPPLPWDAPKQRIHAEGERVVLLHGLWRGFRAMDPLARRLHQEGFCTLNLPDPSSRLPLHTILDRIRPQIIRFAENHRVHFVTHSLGGILLRAMLADSPPWITGRSILLAPPNQGSEIVDWSAKHPIIHALLGPAGRDLGTHGAPTRLPGLPANLESAVIMGNKGTIPFFKRILGSDNDGIVSCERGRVDGMRDFRIIDADHTFIQQHPKAIEMTLRFLRKGHLE
jgi:hypothetical protein